MNFNDVAGNYGLGVIWNDSSGSGEVGSGTGQLILNADGSFSYRGIENESDDDLVKTPTMSGEYSLSSNQISLVIREAGGQAITEMDLGYTGYIDGNGNIILSMKWDSISLQDPHDEEILVYGFELDNVSNTSSIVGTYNFSMASSTDDGEVISENGRMILSSDGRFTYRGIQNSNDNDIVNTILSDGTYALQAGTIRLSIQTYNGQSLPDLGYNDFGMTGYVTADGKMLLGFEWENYTLQDPADEAILATGFKLEGTPTISSVAGVYGIGSVSNISSDQEVTSEIGELTLRTDGTFSLNSLESSSTNDLTERYTATGIFTVENHELTVIVKTYNAQPLSEDFTATGFITNDGILTMGLEWENYAERDLGDAQSLLIGIRINQSTASSGSSSTSTNSSTTTETTGTVTSSNNSNSSSTSTIASTSGNDRLVASSNMGQIDGGDGIDTVVLNSDATTVTKSGSGWSIDGNTLVNVERVQFNNKSIALDMASDQNGGKTALFIGAIAPTLVTDAGSFGTILHFIDNGYSDLVALSQLAIDVGLISGLAGGSSNEALANLVTTNVLGAPNTLISTMLLGYMNGTIASYSQAQFLAAVAATDANQVNVDLVGLNQTGAEFVSLGL